MKKLIALYRMPADADLFLAHYRDIHIKLVRKLPGLVTVEATQIDKTFLGEQGNFMLVEMSFADAESFKAAMKSPENNATGADLKTFADGLVTVMAGTVVEY